ncbi:hypothetical protein CSC76_12300 [Pseudoxanthomonas mexicana]|uniref:sensor histidine kinase n=1 Tax=Pseudoxanthomonas mexicana TaxID=128785 RepID=UPI00138A2164|nr:histidine kinase [Pseudoxanthomonas mexicana]KAF1725291.1 hypothetical protein CSC76_12300 [Pseudoxanthomonas mexicana]
MPSPSALLLQLFRLQEEERARVGRALHNQVGQALSAIRMGAHLVQSEDDADLRAEDLHEIIRTSDETVAILRDLHAHLHPPQLDAIGLDAALRAEVERHFAPGTLSVSLPPLPRAPQADLALVAFRIGQALLRQAATRADGGAQVTLTDDDAAFVLSARHIPGDLPDAALWRALASAAGGRLDDEGGSHWRLRLPYGPKPATSPDPA